MSQTSTPVRIDIDANFVKIVWTDGQSSELTAKQLRELCQCAHCVHEITGQKLINPSLIRSDIQIIKAEPTGHYGMTVVFTDSHSTGIYAYDFLRAQTI